MALTDILISSGQNDFLLLEIPLDILNVPDDILFGTSILEIPVGSLNAPDDILYGVEGDFIMEIPIIVSETFTVFTF